MNIKLNPLIDHLDKLKEQCQGKDPILVDVKYVTFETMPKSTLKGMFNIKPSVVDDNPSPYFEIEFVYQGIRSNLSIGHIFNLDISEIKRRIIEQNGDENLASIENIKLLIKLHYVEILPLLETFSGKATNYTEIARMIIEKGPILLPLYNMGF